MEFETAQSIALALSFLLMGVWGVLVGIIFSKYFING